VRAAADRFSEVVSNFAFCAREMTPAACFHNIMAIKALGAVFLFFAFFGLKKPERQQKAAE
jgi:hypothetical protein